MIAENFGHFFILITLLFFWAYIIFSIFRGIKQVFIKIFENVY